MASDIRTPYPYRSIFNGILCTHDENTLLLERSKYTLMSTYILESF